MRFEVKRTSVALFGVAFGYVKYERAIVLICWPVEVRLSFPREVRL